MARQSRRRVSRKQSKKAGRKQRRQQRKSVKRGGSFVNALRQIAVPAALLYGQKTMRKRRSSKKH
jgi:hypothetical protein